MPVSRSRAAAVAIALVATAFAASAQAPEPQIFLDRVDVDVVNLEVVVTDRRGDPVHGLTRDDFVVLEDGDRVELTNFFAVERGSRRDGEGAEAPLLDLGVEPAEQAELPVEQRLSLAVVIDNGNIDPPSRKRVLDQLREHLTEVLRPGDRVLIATLEPQLEVRQNFTGDPAAIDAALEAIGRSSAGRADLFSQRRMIRHGIATLDGAGGGTIGGGGLAPDSRDTPADAADRLFGLITSYATQAEAQMRHTFRSLESVTASLAGLPGRRGVLLVSEHLATNPAEGLLLEWYDAFSALVPGLRPPFNEARRWDVGTDLRDVAHRAAADRVTFYTLHASGVLGSMPGAGDGAVIGTPGAGADLGRFEPLMHLAAATGGASMLSSVNAAVLVEQMSADYRDYYSLGYSSPKSQDGRYHRIQVRLPGHDVRIRHTEGYRAKTAAERMNERTLAALMFDLAENPLDVRVQLMPEQAEGRNFILPVLVRVPISQLALVPHENEHIARISIVIALRDADGRMSDPQRVEVPISIPNANLLEAMGQEIGHGLNLSVRRGDAKLAVGVRDELSAVESTLNLSVSVGKV
ncbi:MAG TPA: VWA domain-containing protein [Thermoanaerobaculia bacterium]|nr:VWA domain-containing protein [Thermoanaerobaculia bacterium]